MTLCKWLSLTYGANIQRLSSPLVVILPVSVWTALYLLAETIKLWTFCMQTCRMDKKPLQVQKDIPWWDWSGLKIYTERSWRPNSSWITSKRCGDWCILSLDSIKDIQQQGSSLVRANELNLFFNKFSTGVPLARPHTAPISTLPQQSKTPCPVDSPRIDTTRLGSITN